MAYTYNDAPIDLTNVKILAEEKVRIASTSGCTIGRLYILEQNGARRLYEYRQPELEPDHIPPTGELWWLSKTAQPGIFEEDQAKWAKWLLDQDIYPTSAPLLRQLIAE